MMFQVFTMSRGLILLFSDSLQVGGSGPKECWRKAKIVFSFISVFAVQTFFFCSSATYRTGVSSHVK